MKREILFKGWCPRNEKWIEGDVIFKSSGVLIRRRSDSMCFEVDPSTICQYTGAKDKNGVKIFEYDVLEAYMDDLFPAVATAIEIVRWAANGWYLQEVRDDYLLEPNEPLDENDIKLWTVAGNVFDNPELLGKMGGGDGA